MTPEKEPERWLLHLRKAAGAQISQCSKSEEVTPIINVFVLNLDNWNENDLKLLSRIN